MPNLVPRSDELRPTIGAARTPVVSDRRSSRGLSQLERQTMVRVASVQAHTVVQVEKTHEIDRITREAMTGQAMLHRWAATLAQGDPFLADDLQFFSNLARMGKGEIIADTISDLCQER